MLRNSLIYLAMLAALALVAGCSDGSVDPISGGGDDMSTAQMAELALESDLMTERSLTSELAGMQTAPQATTDDGEAGTVTRDASFSVTRPCPGGGEFSLEGMIHLTFDRDTGVMEAELSGSRTRTDCVFPAAGMTVTVNGSASWEAFRRRVDGRPDGPQTTRYYGSWTAVRSDGEERSCDFDVTIVRDPDTHTRTLDGTICGNEVHLSVTWSHDG